MASVYYAFLDWKALHFEGAPLRFVALASRADAAAVSLSLS